jgi:cytochrome c peroxidase
MGMGRGTRQAQAAPAAENLTRAPAPSGDHASQYLDAINVVESMTERLTNEMQRIHSAEVAHYDFLQFEHLELIRHARALHHPPGSLDNNIRDSLNGLAEQLLTAANDLEWLIADFLRAEAMIRVMNSHIEIPETSELAGDMGDPELLQLQYREAALGLIEQMGEARVSGVVGQLRGVYVNEVL